MKTLRTTGVVFVMRVSISENQLMTIGLSLSDIIMRRVDFRHSLSYNSN